MRIGGIFFVLAMGFATAQVQAGVAESFARLPLFFEPNRGQAASDIRFVAKGARQAFFFKSNEVICVLSTESGTASIRMHWPGRVSAAVEGALPLSGKSNYLFGNIPAQWKTGIEHYRQVRYRNVWPGVDLLFYGTQHHLEYDVVISPGASPSRVEFVWEGADRIEIDSSGELVLHTAAGPIRHGVPRSYQQSNREVASRYVLRGKNRIGFDLGSYDPSQPLTIDPTVATLYELKGSGSDNVRAIGRDAAGNIYIAGITTSSDFPIRGGVQATHRGGVFDIFLAKLKPQGDDLIYSTLVGGSKWDSFGGLAVDSAGNAYVAGGTDSTDFPTVNPFQGTLKSDRGGDAFLFKLNPAGNALVYSTYFGGVDSDGASGIAIDGTGSVFLAGTTRSADFPTRNPIQPVRTPSSDAFVTKFDPSGSTLIYSTPIGGSGDDFAEGMVVDSSGNAYLTGETESLNFPVVSPIQPTLNGIGVAGTADAFICKINSAGSALLASTYLGGSGFDEGEEIALDAAGNVSVAGRTESAKFPTRNPIQPNPAGSCDVFVCKLNGAVTAIIFSTYLGGSGCDRVRALAIDASGNTFVGGGTSSTNFPLVDPVQPALSGEEDAYISVFNPEGSQLLFSTFLGGGGGDNCTGMVLIPALSGPVLGFAKAFPASGQREAFSLSASEALLVLETYPQGSNSGHTDARLSTLSFEPLEPPLDIPFTAADASDLAVGSIPSFFPISPFSPEWGRQSLASDSDPVVTATGEYVYSAVDLLLGGPVRLSFGRYYGTLLGAAAQARSFYNEADSPMGANWVHNFLLLLRKVDDSRVTVYYYQGKTVTFRKSGNAWVMAQPSGPTFKGARYQLVESGTKLKMLDPRLETILTFEFAGLSTGGVRAVESISDRNGNTLTLTYGTDGTLQKVADGLGRSLEFSYVVSGGKARVAKVTDQSGRFVQFDYDGVNLKSSTTAVGKTTSYTYSGKSLLETIMRPAGNVSVRNNYAADSSRVVSQADGAGNTTRFDYSAGSTRITDALGNPTTHSFDAQLRLTRYTDAAGKTIQYGYDSSQRQTSMTDRLGDSSSISYDSATGKVASRTDASGKLWRYTYATQTQDGFSFSVLARRDYPDGTREERAYDAKGNLLTRTDRAGKVWAYTYNAQGQVATATNPERGVWTYAYNPDATLASVKDPADNVTLLEYDGIKRLRKMTHADGASVQHSYDADDRLLTRINENEKTTTFVYDDNGNLKTATNQLGKTWTLTYDANDRLTRLVNPLDQSTTFIYEGLRRLQSRTDPNGNTVTLNYDARGRMTSIVDGSGKTWTRGFDDEGVPVSSANPLGEIWRLGSDKQGRITGITNPLGNQTRIEYDALSRPTSATNALDETRSWSYDVRGLLSQASEPGPIRAAYARNDLGRITQITDPRGKTQTFSYDNLGRLTSATDPLGNRTAVEYDKRSRPARINFPQGNLAVAYDPVGLIKSLHYADSTRLDFNYDATNRLTGASGIDLLYDDNHRLISSNGITVARDAGGRITSMTLAPGKTVSYGYDSRNLLVSVTDWAGAVTRFSHDDAGRLTSIARGNGVVTTYTYDTAGRITGIVEAKDSRNLSSIALTRDAAGRTKQAAREVPLPPRVPAASRTQTFNDGDQVVGWGHDSLGRVTSDAGARTYTWDLASRLTSYRDGTASVRFTYDALGNRLTRQQGNSTRSFVWNYALGLPSVSLVKEGEATLRYYVHTPAGSLLYSIEEGSNSRRYYHYDEMGSTLFLTDDSGAITDRYAYTPYGQIVDSSGTTDNPFTFIGRWGVMAEGKGLYYMRARYYDSVVGRFLSRDPLRGSYHNPKSTNPYQYARGNSLCYIDPQGTYSLVMLPPWMIVRDLSDEYDDGDEDDDDDDYDDNEEILRPKSGPPSIRVEDPPWDPIKQRPYDPLEIPSVPIPLPDWPEPGLDDDLPEAPPSAPSATADPLEADLSMLPPPVFQEVLAFWVSPDVPPIPAAPVTHRVGKPSREEVVARALIEFFGGRFLDFD